ncbi:hypothetical protein ABIE78_002663 [Sinorhizobium fredii]|uniref:hypothetical protein n=1 Tax=Rhizobium fredii TaxID=380 RepID=UPI0009B6FD04|nr:hypothetical protein [Sinorhizobium fredii]
MHVITSAAATKAATPLLSTGRASRPAARRVAEGMRDWWKSIGLFSEMISGRMRFFVPMTEEGPAILGRRIERHRIIDVVSRT